MSTACPKGHAHTPENGYLNKRHEWICRVCRKEFYDQNYRSNKCSPHVTQGRPRPNEVGHV